MTDETAMLARAGDYVLGLMDDAERARAELDLQKDESFREAIVRLASHLHQIDLTASAEPIPDTMWDNIKEHIRALPSAGGGVSPSKPEISSDGNPRIGNAGWARRVAMAACLLLGAGLGYLVRDVFMSPPQPVVVVVLDTEANTPGAVFEAYSDRTIRILPLEDFNVPEGKTLQVWTLYDRAVGPVSLGTLANARETILTGPEQPLPQPEQLYEITLEPYPGSPTGKPTGPILVKGFAKPVPGI